MKKLLLFTVLSFITLTASAQGDCFTRLEKAFQKRGSYTVSDDMHRNVIISFITPDGSICYSGKVRVENGYISHIFIQYQEGDYELMEKKFFNEKKQPPTVTNGISELIYTADGEKLRVVFIDKLKPKQKEYKQVDLPDDL